MYEMSMLSQTDQIAWLRQLLLALPDGYAAHALMCGVAAASGAASSSNQSPMQGEPSWQIIG
jgi:hypothetical protein